MMIYIHFPLPEAERDLLTQALQTGVSSPDSSSPGVSTDTDTCVWGQDLPAAQRKEAFLQAEVVFGNPPADWWAESRNLRWVQLYSAGFDPYLALDWTRPELQSVTVTNLRGFFGQPVAETAVAGVMALYRKIDELARLQAQSRWVGGELRPQMNLLYRKRVLVLGAGAIGETIMKILRGFDCHVTLVRRSQAPTVEDLDELLPEADIIMAALPDTEETKNTLSAQRLALMKPSAVVVNVGRGSAIDEPALTDALQHNRLAGAVLDVTYQEPLPGESPLWSMTNVLLTQHTGGGYAEENADKVRVFLRNLDRYRAGEPLENVVDFSRGY
ncbi:D-2-hydroxyacid dehydrogenase [Nibrella saemangeumensis]|uniref:D-2-hydroxyacid dehydrogenase n=1 Tax=Nibrella saemangeumensis TaxID=1084526 RepID=A0ABP8MVD8_9BACT